MSGRRMVEALHVVRPDNAGAASPRLWSYPDFPPLEVGLSRRLLFRLLSRSPIARLAAVALAVLIPALPARAPAQIGSPGTVQGSVIQGTVLDSATGLPIPRARITVINTALGAMSDEHGEYRLAGLASGEYRLVASASRRESVIRSIRLSAGEIATADFRLGIGSVLLPGVVVTATRTPVIGRDLAAVVHVLSPEQIRTSPARTTDDLLREAPGVELPRTSSTVSGPEEIVSLRGADEGRTLVLLDDVPLNDPWGEWIQWNRAPRSQLDRVEIVEGGSSSLYGNYAMGGVISLFSRPIAPHSYNLSASAGSRGELELSAYGSDVAGRLGYSIGGDYGTGGGYTLIAPSQRGPIDRASNVTRRSVNARADYSVGGGTTVSASASYFGDDRELGTPLTQPNRRNIVSGSLGAMLESVAGGSLTLRAFGQRQRYDSRAARANSPRTSEIPIETQTIPSHDVGGSFQWTRHGSALQSLSFGGDVRYTTGRLDETLLTSAGSVSGTRSSGGSQQVGGLFVQGILAPVRPLRVELSARVDGWRSYNGYRLDASTIPAASVDYTSKTNAAFAPRVGLRYELLSSLALRGSAYRSFRAPTLSEEYRTFFAGPNTFRGNPYLTPEYLTGYDAGLDWRPVPAVEVRATAFLNNYRDLDDFVFLMSGATPGSAILQRQNLGRARARGAEGEIAVRPVERLGLVASYNYDDARVLSTGKFVNRVPLQRGTLRATYDDPRSVQLDVIYRYEGTNHALGGHRLGPFSVVDAEARRELLDGVAVFLAVENIFDRVYAVNFSGPLESIGLPRTVRGGLSLQSF